MRKIFIILFATLLVQSCSCYIISKGVIIDSITKKPIEDAEIRYINVECVNFETNEECVGLTDEFGEYDMDSNDYGFCPDIDVQIRVSKKGYRTREITLSGKNNDTIELVKL